MEEEFFLWRDKMKENKAAIVLHGIMVILELIAVIHDIRVFGGGMFQYYTIDSNVLQMIVSACLLAYLLRGKSVPAWLTVLHLISAVCLTVTFMIAAFVLAPQEGFAYYFLANVAPINHFLGPVFSMITFVFLQTGPQLKKRMVFAPPAATLLYGVIVLILNALRVLDGPYFFLRVYETPVSAVIMWFLIIAVLSIALSALYMWLRNFVRHRHKR